MGESRLVADVASSRAEVASKEHPDELVVSADGLMVHSEGCWQEMKRAEPFGELLYLEALRRGVEHADRVIFVADGAVWIWKLAEHHFPNAVQMRSAVLNRRTDSIFEAARIAA